MTTDARIGSRWHRGSIREGCVLSPLLFNVFFAAILLVAQARFNEDAYECFLDTFPCPHPSDGFKTDSCLFGQFPLLSCAVRSVERGPYHESANVCRLFLLFGRCNPKWFSTAFLMTIDCLGGAIVETIEHASRS